MNTGMIEGWHLTVADIGPMYPFVGLEFLLFIVCFAFWIYWHIRQTRMENKIYEEDMEKLGDKLTLTRIVKGEEAYLDRGAPRA